MNLETPYSLDANPPGNLKKHGGQHAAMPHVIVGVGTRGPEFELDGVPRILTKLDGKRFEGSGADDDFRSGRWKRAEPSQDFALTSFREC